MKVGIIGAAGRMGRILIEATLANPDTTLAAAVDVPGSSLIGADAGELVGQGSSGVLLADDLSKVVNCGCVHRLHRAGSHGKEP